MRITRVMTAALPAATWTPKTSTSSPVTEESLRRWLIASTSARVSRSSAARSNSWASEAPHIDRLEVAGELVVAAGEEERGALHRARVLGVGGQPGHARAQATVHVVVEAGPRQRAVDRDAADPHLEQLLHQLDRLPRQSARQEGPEVVAAVVADAAGEGDARVGVAHRQLQVGIGLVVAEQDVVAGPLALDPVVLQQQRLGLGVGDDELQLRGLGPHRLQPRVGHRLRGSAPPAS